MPSPLREKRIRRVIFLSIVLLIIGLLVAEWIPYLFNEFDRVTGGAYKVGFVLFVLFVLVLLRGFKALYSAGARPEQDDDGPKEKDDKTEVTETQAQEPTIEAPGRYDQRREPQDPARAATHDEGSATTFSFRYTCPKCRSDKVIVQEQGPNPVGVDEGFFLFRPLKAMARSVGISWGNRFCQNCGHKW
jgi:hypothetical protein